MKQRVVILVAWLALAAGAAPAEQPRPAGPVTACQPCHVAERPMHGRAELAGCLRVEPRVLRPVAEGPDAIVMGAGSEGYGPVTFSHRAHAAMAEMRGGCIECHHEATEGRAMRMCGDCHALERRREDVAVPDRKAALHRQCIGCHETWDRAVGCGSCHASDAAAAAPAADTAGAAAWVGNTFHHGLACRDCHRRDDPAAALDPACASCHADWPKSFDHAKTGLVLDETHAEASCGDCHGDAAFAGKPSCTECHDDKSYPADLPGVRLEGAR